MLLCFNGCHNTQNKSPLTTSQKIADFKYMYSILMDNYPYFEVNKRENHVDWINMKSTFINEIEKTKSDRDFYNTLTLILYHLHNWHAHMLDNNTYSYDKQIYSQNPQENAAWLKELNNPKALLRYPKSIDSQIQVQSSTTSVYGNVNTAVLSNGSVGYLSIYSFGQTYIESDRKIIEPFLQRISNAQKLIIDIRKNGGGSTNYWANNLVSLLATHEYNVSDYILFRGGSFCMPFIKSRYGHGYDDLTPISGLPALPNLPQEAKTNFKYYIKSTVTIQPENSVRFNGKIYLLVDHSVFSSSETFAAFCKESGFATLVGERTGGDGIGFDPAFCTLPNSGYVFSFPQMMGLSADGTCDFEYGTKPDIEVSAVVGENLSKDKAVQTILRLS